MTRGPGNELAASAAGRGHLRASHADRDHVVDFLKAAFVQGRLTREELEERAGQAYASRTYGELAKLTADLPHGPIAAPPPRRAAPARARRLPTGRAALLATGVLGPPAVLAAAILTNNEELARVFAMIFPWYFMGWLVAVAQILDNLRDRSRAKRPPRPPQPGWALDGEPDGGTGDDLMLAEARDYRRADRVRGCGASKCARRPPVRPARQLRADLRITG